MRIYRHIVSHSDPNELAILFFFVWFCRPFGACRKALKGRPDYRRGCNPRNGSGHSPLSPEGATDIIDVFSFSLLFFADEDSHIFPFSINIWSVIFSKTWDYQP